MSAQRDSRPEEERDERPVAIRRDDAIDAVAGLMLLARAARREAKSRQWTGERWAGRRAWLRNNAAVYEQAAERVQAAADRAF